MANMDRLPYASLGMDPDNEVEDFLLMIDSLLQPYLNQAINRVPEGRGLKAGVEYQIRSGGKRIRAAMCATVCEAFCGSYQPALSFAAAMELLHNFTLIHDDISDGDTHRRGQPSAWKRFGLAQSITVGDLFAALSALAILEADWGQDIKLSLIQMICTFGLEVAEGQSLDITSRQSDTPSVTEYLQCVRKKSGAFLAMATVGGAMIGGGANENVLATLKEATMLAGTAFQIKDDLLDLMDGKARPIGSDTLEGKRTLLVIHTLQHAEEGEKQRLLDILNKPRIAKTAAEIQWVGDLYRRIGAVEYAQETCEQLIEQAEAHFMTLPENEVKKRLSRITHYLVTRVH
jgi:geranylgeranyl diphosphate synthase, type I